MLAHLFLIVYTSIDLFHSSCNEMSANIFLSCMQQVVRIPKVNRHFLDSIRREEEELDADVDHIDKSSTRKKRRRLELKKALLTDPRFEEMFVNKVHTFRFPIRFLN